MENSGRAIIGIGIGMGEDRAIEAARQAVSSPLLETSIEGATDAIINITGGVNLTLFEAEQAAEVVRAASQKDINTIFGSVINENLSEEVIVTVIATGFDKDIEEEKEEEPEELLIPTTSRRSQVPKNVEALSEKEEKPNYNTDVDNDDIPIFLRERSF
jgi:cell division protein FtsZ